MKSIMPFLTFNGEAEEALEYYQEVFKEAEVKMLNRYDEDSDMAGKVLQGAISIQDQLIMVNDINASEEFKFTPSMSFLIECLTRDEIELYYRKLKKKGAIQVPLDDYGNRTFFAWVQDQFGVSWQLNFKS